MMKPRSFSMFLVISALLAAILACNFTPSEESTGEDTEETVQANNAQLTIQAQSVQLTSMASTLAAPPPQQSPAQPIVTQPPQAPPAQPPQQPTQPFAGAPSIRTAAAVSCWKIGTIDHVGDEILETLPAGYEAPILLKSEERENESMPWQVARLKVTGPGGCTCWVDIGDVQVMGSLEGIGGQFSVFPLDIAGSCP